MILLAMKITVAIYPSTPFLIIKLKVFLLTFLSGDVIELLIYHQPGVKPSLTMCPFGLLGYMAGHSLTNVKLLAGLGFNSRGEGYIIVILPKVMCM